MAVKVKRRTSTGDKALTKKNGRKPAAGKCLMPKSTSCPRVQEQASPYAYQKGCRAVECYETNSEYYKAFRALQREEREKAAKRAKRSKVKRTPRKAA